jgi:hypothetical protein
MGDALLVSMSVMSSFIFFKVFVKRTLSPLPPSMSTLWSLEPAITGFRTSGKRLGSEKLVYWFVREKVMDTSDYLRGVDTVIQCSRLPIGCPSETVWWVVR